MRMWRRRQWRINAPPPPFYLLIVAEMNASVALLVSRTSRPHKRGRWRIWGLTHRRDNRSFKPPYEGLGLNDVGEFDTMLARFRVRAVYDVALCIEQSSLGDRSVEGPASWRKLLELEACRDVGDEREKMAGRRSTTSGATPYAAACG